MSALAEPGIARALQVMFECPSERFTVEALASVAEMSWKELLLTRGQQGLNRN